MTTGELVRLLDGTLDGDPTIPIDGLAGLDDAQPGQVSFLSSRRYAARVPATRASAVVVPRDWTGTAPCAVIRVDRVEAALSSLIAAFAPPSPATTVSPGVHPSAVVAPDVQLGADCAIGPCCVIEAGAVIGPRTVLVAHCAIGPGATIGADGLLYPFVTVRDRVTIGERVILHSGAVIGDDGFGYDRQPDGSWTKIPQTGSVEIGDDVEIGSNTCVDRARFGRTVIADGVKLDNLVMVAHNVHLGAHTAVAAQAGFSGSVRVGSRVQVAGQAGFSGHIEVGDDAFIAGRAGVTKSLPAGAVVSDFPALDHRAAQKRQAHVARLPKLVAKVRELEARLNALEETRT